MSGGSFNYAYRRLNDFIEQLEDESITPTRKELQFIRLLKLVSEVMRKVEYAHSDDISIEESDEAISELFSDIEKLQRLNFDEDLNAVSLYLVRKAFQKIKSDTE